jgi:hypothetical protein
MRNFIEYLRSSETENGRLGAILGGDPTSAPTGLAEPGFGSVNRIQQRNPQRERGFTEARRLVDRVLRGDRWAALRFSEAMTTSDFGVYFGDILDRSVLQNYAETPYSWSKYAKRATIRDFRQAKIFRFDRGAGVLDGPIVPAVAGRSAASGPTGIAQVTEYPMAGRVASQYVDQLYKFGRLMDYSWEVMVNDDLDMLRDTPALFGRAARRTEESRATKLFATATGPNATFFSNANMNRMNTTVLTNLLSFYGLPNNPPFSLTALQAAMNIVANQVDLDGEPISIEMFILVYPPSLDIPVKNVLNGTQVWYNDMGGSNATSGNTSLERIIADNWAKQVVQPAKNYYLPIVDTTSGKSAWYLFGQPSGGRPAMQLSFLSGHESPELFMKAPNQIAIGESATGGGGGQGNPMDGDFDSDSILYKVRHVIGGTLLDPICGVASTGTGTGT